MALPAAVGAVLAPLAPLRGAIPGDTRGGLASPAKPPRWQGALLVVAMTLGFLAGSGVQAG